MAYLERRPYHLFFVVNRASIDEVHCYAVGHDLLLSSFEQIVLLGVYFCWIYQLEGILEATTAPVLHYDSQAEV